MCGKNLSGLACGIQNAGARRSDVATKWSAELAQTRRACSGCAGDYEDPDRTAWPTDEERAEENDEARGSRAGDEFPEELPEKTD